MSEHALLSPSSAHRWLTCQGSVAMEAKFTRSKTSQSAEYGTACHELAQWALTDEQWDCKNYLGRKTANGLTITEDMVGLVNEYTENIFAYSTGHTLLIEQKVDFSSHIGVPGSFGTSDAIVIVTDDSKELQIHDLKTGYHMVHARENPQLMLYALGALHEFSPYADFEFVRLVIHQPSQHHLDEWVCTVEDLLKFGRKARQAALNAVNLIDWPHEVDINDYLQPEEKACQYCKAAATCPALAKKVSSTVGAEFEDLTKDVEQLVPKDNSLLSQKMTAAPLIENWIKSIRAQVERELLSGQDVPGYKIVQGKQGNRRWADEKEVTKQMKSMKMSKEQMYNSTLISPTDAEKLLKIAPEKWEQIKHLVTRSEGSLSVAPESDRRPAVIITAADEMFQNEIT